MNATLTNLFEIMKGSSDKTAPNLTEERIYSYSHYFLTNNHARVPVLSGSTMNDGVFGYVPDLRSKEIASAHKPGTAVTVAGIAYYRNKTEGCISIVADGVYAGFSFYRPLSTYPVFCLNSSCLALFIKSSSEITTIYPDFDGLNLEWFNLKFHSQLLNVLRGAGVKHFTKMICESITDLPIPALREQEQELMELRKIHSIKNSCNGIRLQIGKVLSKEVNGFTIKEEDDFSNIFNVDKGTGGFTEEAIYHSSPKETDESIPVFGGEKTHKFPKYFVSENATNLKGKRVKFFQKNCLILSMDGSAGCMTVKSNSEKFTLNHHAAVLTLKEKYAHKFNLKWFKHAYQNTLIDSSVSKKSSRTLSKESLRGLVITAPDRRAQDDWVEEIEKLEKVNEKFQLITDKIDRLIAREVVS